MLRLFGKLAAFACVAGIASCGTFIWQLDSRRQPEPALIAGLPMNDGLAPPGKQEFTARLAARFPIGSREADLVRNLWLQGFKPITDLSAPERKAAFGTDLHQFNVCVVDAVVSWSADSAGQLTAISGFANHTCL
jgi:hypothetical protein